MSDVSTVAGDNKINISECS